MKKSLFVVGMAALALASCTNEEVLNVADNRAISFDNAFVGNSTKTTDITTDDITEFYVFGGYDQSLTKVWGGKEEKVSKSGDDWTYENTQYWSAGKSYKFQAYAPSLTTNGATATASEAGVNFANFTADGNIDLLVSDVKTESGDAQIAKSTPIALQFRHVLSKIKFNFTTDLENVNIAISNLKVTQLPNTGNYNGTQWTVSGAGEYTLPITGTLTNDAQNGITSSDVTVLPQTTGAGVKVSFTITTTGGLTLTANHEVALPETTFDEGFVYTFTSKLTADNIDPENPLVPIEFGKPEVGDWTDGGTTNIPEYPIQ